MTKNGGESTLHFPPLRRFASRMITLPPAQSAASSGASVERPHVLAVSKMQFLSAPTLESTDGTTGGSGSASGTLGEQVSIFFKFWGKKMQVVGTEQASSCALCGCYRFHFESDFPFLKTGSLSVATTHAK